jgi:hypothetical protein
MDTGFEPFWSRFVVLVDTIDPWNCPRVGDTHISRVILSHLRLLIHKVSEYLPSCEGIICLSDRTNVFTMCIFICVIVCREGTSVNAGC